MPFADSDGIRIFYEDTGEGEPALLCLPGWCNTRTIFEPLAKRLSADHRVLALDWRGHGDSQASDRDFGFAEMAGDAVAVMQDSGAQAVIPIAQGQAPWAAVELHRLVGERMPKMVASSWPVISPSANPLASRFLNAIRALQYYERWREGTEQLLTMWLSGAPASVERHIRDQMLLQGYATWSRAGREILAMYALEGEPLRVLSALSPQVPVLHVYCQPRAPEFLAIQESFAEEHPWYSVHRLEGVSQFPTLEVPEQMASVIGEFIR
jgi:pimeloyl-ACP methyl ester carboxylesterase